MPPPPLESGLHSSRHLPTGDSELRIARSSAPSHGLCSHLCSQAPRADRRGANGCRRWRAWCRPTLRTRRPAGVGSSSPSEASSGSPPTAPAGSSATERRRIQPRAIRDRSTRRTPAGVVSRRAASCWRVRQGWRPTRSSRRSARLPLAARPAGGAPPQVTTCRSGTVASARLAARATSSCQATARVPAPAPLAAAGKRRGDRGRQRCTRRGTAPERQRAGSPDQRSQLHPPPDHQPCPAEPLQRPCNRVPARCADQDGEDLGRQPGARFERAQDRQGPGPAVPAARHATAPPCRRATSGCRDPAAFRRSPYRRDQGSPRWARRPARGSRRHRRAASSRGDG